MRKLVEGLAMLSTPLIATALLVGCQQNTAGENSSGATSPQALAEQNDSQIAAQPGERGQLGDLADEALEACGFKCKLLAEGSASISGDRRVDAFFDATLTLRDKAALLKGEVTATLGEMAALVGAEVGANIGDTAANIEAAISGGFGGAIDGGISVAVDPPRCEVSAEAAIQASAKCDVEVDPGTAEVKCQGTCEADANVMVECSGSAELKCTGTAPNLACEGECKGSCELNAGVQCEGECKGSCEVESAAECDGEFTASTGEGANGGGTCKVRTGAQCEGTCKGSCELSGGAQCEGQCKGECTYTPPSGMCEATAKASCEGSAQASVECKGECNGTVEPPAVKPECEATAQASAQFEAECFPPSVRLDYDLSAEFEANASADAKAELGAKLEAFGKAYGELIAKGAELKGILEATAALPEAGVEAVTGIASGLTTSGDLQVAFDMGCAVTELGKVPAILNGARADLEASVSAIGTVTGAVGS